MAEKPKPDKKCKIKDCKRPYRAKGYCNVHYKKWRHGEFGLARYKICKNEGCHKPMKRFGMCAEHFEAWSKSRQAAASITPAEAAPAPAAEAAAAAPAEAPPEEKPAEG